MAAATGALEPVSAHRCDVCHLQLAHRTGSYSVALKADRAVYAPGQPIVIRLRIANAGPNPLFVDPDRQVRHFTVHIIAPGYKETQPDRPLPRSGRAIHAGGSFLLPAHDLQRWDVMLKHLGTYRLNMSYGSVDSNTLTFVVR
jgi:hypothetical protein